MVTVPETTAGGDGGFWTNVGWGASGAGMALSAVGAYYAVEAQKGNLRQQALAADFQAQQSAQNAEQAEKEAQAILSAGQGEKMALTLRQGQERAGLLAGQGASGTAIGGPGSNAEVRASQRLLQRIEAMNLDSNAIRAANAARTQSVNARNESDLARVSARNMRGTAGSLNPYLAAGASVFGSAGTLAAQWAYRDRTTRRSN